MKTAVGRIFKCGTLYRKGFGSEMSMQMSEIECFRACDDHEYPIEEEGSCPFEHIYLFQVLILQVHMLWIIYLYSVQPQINYNYFIHNNQYMDCHLNSYPFWEEVT